jgi:predicted DCC family thiol-disulfide oxidoreductase YuxK
VRFISRRDRRKSFRFVPLQSEEGRGMLRDAGLPAEELDTVVYVKDGSHLVRSSAVLGIVMDLGGAWRLLRGFRIIPVTIRDFFYRLIARNRHRLTRHGRK